MTWAALAALVLVAETGAIRSVLIGDTLSETIWWAYGPRHGLRWWFLGCTVAALFLWAPVHWLYPAVNGRHLLYMVGAAVVVALTGWALTRG